VVLQVVLAITFEVLQHRRSGEPFAGKFIQPARLEKCVVARIVHQNRQREVAIAENDQRHDYRKSNSGQVWPEADDGKRSGN
jgi:hypothetical protein